jgi:DNA-binding PadR family transcriptional regulator
MTRPGSGLPTEGRTKDALLQAALRLLEDGRERFGGQLWRESARGSRIPRAFVYMLLAELERRGLIRSREEGQIDPKVGVVRRLYVITDAGRQALQQEQIAPSA